MKFRAPSTIALALAVSLLFPGVLWPAQKFFSHKEFNEITDVPGMITYMESLGNVLEAGRRMAVLKVNTPPGINPQHVMASIPTDVTLNKHGVGWERMLGGDTAILTVIHPGCYIHQDEIRMSRERQIVQREVALRLLQPDDTALFVGQVLDPRGKPASGAIVRLAGWAWMRADEQGKFLFKAVSPGTLLARAESPEGEIEVPVTFKPGKAVEMRLRIKDAPTIGIRWTLQREPENPVFSGPGVVEGEAYFSPYTAGLSYSLERGAVANGGSGYGSDFNFLVDEGKIVYRIGHTDGRNGLHEENLPYSDIHKVNNGEPFNDGDYFYRSSFRKSPGVLKLGHVFTLRCLSKDTYAKMEIIHLPAKAERRRR